MRFRRIQSQILLIAIVPLLTMAVLAGAYLVMSRHLLLEEKLAEEGQSAARYIALASEYGLLVDDKQALEQIAIQALQDANIVRVAIRNGWDETVVDKHDGLRPYYPDSIVVTQPVFTRGTSLASGAGTVELVGMTCITLDHAPTRKRQYGAVAFATALLAALLAFAWYAAVQLSRAIATPVGRISSAMRAIEAGALDTRVPVAAQNELRELEEGTNRMAKALQEGRDNLEALVRAATQDYARANAELARQNERLAAARETAEAATRAKSAFLANMSHEIRTPLNSIVGFTQLIRRDESALPEKVRTYLNGIAIASGNLFDLVNGVLDLARIEAGKVSCSLEIFNLVELLDDVAEELYPLAKDKGLYIDMVPYIDVPREIVGDRTHLHQVLTNLITNATKFTHEGGVVVRVLLDQELDERAVLRFEVADTGQGIAAADLSRLFQAFEQLDSSMARRHEGSGLGLAICKGLVELMDGQIGVESEGLGRGACFWFRIPVKRSESMLAPAAAIAPLADLRAAVADERLSFRQSVQTHLADLGVEVDAFANVADMLAAANHYDAVLLRCTDPAASPRLCQEAAKDGCVALCRVDADTLRGGTLTGQVEAQVPMPLRTRILREALQGLLDPGAASARPAPPASVSGSPLTGLRLLVVDDNALNRRFLIELLSIYGPVLMEAESAIEAVQCVFRHGPAIDLVLMDLHMPGMDGRDAARTIREAGYAMPIVAVTANALPETRNEALAAGMDDFITKPVTEQALLETLHRLLPHRCAGAVVEPGGADRLGRLQSELRNAFRAYVPHYLTALEEIGTVPSGQVRALAHQMAGAAATCYLPEIADAARALERLAVEGGAGPALAERIAALRNALRHTFSDSVC